MKQIFPRLLFLLYIVIMMWLCFGRIPEDNGFPTSVLGIPMDKLVHFIMFLPFPFLLWWNFKWKVSSAASLIVSMLAILVAGLSLALLTECVQGLIPFRYADVADFFADSIAVFLGTLGVLFFSINELDNAK